MENKIPQSPPVYSSEAIMETVAKLRSTDDSSVKPLSEHSRVNEQELFAAFTYLQLQEKQPEAATDFLSKFRSAVEAFGSDKSQYSILDITRSILKEFRKAKVIPRAMFKKIRRVSLGLSQLDSVKDDVNSSRVTNGSNDTALRSFKTALTKIAENTVASEADLRNFVTRNKNRGPKTSSSEPDTAL
jgi:hypothetical protein